MTRPAREREALWGEVERELRRYVRLFSAESEWLWEPAEVAFVRAVRPHLEALDAAAGAGRAPPGEPRRPGGG